MDWSKTKTKLIILLLVLNAILLANYLINNPYISRSRPSELTLEDLSNRLEAHGIKYNLDPHKTEKELRPLIVRYSEENTLEVNERYFDSQGEVEVRDGISKITKDQEEITVINNRRFLYENYSNLPVSSNLPDREIALKFLEDRNYDTSDMVLVKTEIWDDATNYEFVKTFNNKILETSYTRITVENKKVTTLDRLWIEVIEEEMRPIEIEPAYKALYSLLQIKDLGEGTIKNMEVCYYFNPEEQGLLEDNTRAERGRAIPAWRIVFENGSKIIVDNY